MALRVRENSKPGGSRGRPNTGRSLSGDRSSFGNYAAFGGRSSIGGQSSLGNRSSIQGLKKPVMGKTGGTRPASGLPTKKRRSSGYGRGGYEQMKDPRPINTRAYKDKCIRKLIEFLSEQGFPHPISNKILSSPQSKDFIRIFEFLYTFMEPKYKMTVKLEDEVPRLFKVFNYPFTISKSAMFAIGSPHTWPALLAALTWLREKIEVFGRINIEQIMFPADDEFNPDSESQNKIIFYFLEETYKMFLKGAESFDPWEEKLAQQIRQIGQVSNLEELMSVNRTRLQELDALQRQPNKLPVLKEKLSSLQLDLNLMDKYHTELETHGRQQIQKKNAVEETLTDLEAELASLTVDVKKKYLILETQQLSQTDIERLHLGQQQLIEQRAAVEKDNEAQHRLIWEEEMAISKAYERIEVRCGEFNKVAQRLKLIPITAENAYGIDYEMKPSSFSCEASSTHFMDTIKPALTKMKYQCKEAVAKTQESIYNEQEACEQVMEMVSEKQETLTIMETQQKRLDESLESKKNMMQQSSLKLQEEVDTLQDEIAREQQQSTMSVSQAQAYLNEERARLGQKAAARRVEMKVLTQQYQQAVMIIVDHKTAIVMHTDKQHKDAVKLKQSAITNQ